jgi:hypothetical protein
VHVVRRNGLTVINKKKGKYEFCHAQHRPPPKYVLGRFITQNDGDRLNAANGPESIYVMHTSLFLRFSWADDASLALRSATSMHTLGQPQCKHHHRLPSLTWNTVQLVRSTRR